jgi:ribosomal protein S18 acetylase RimI-like enzyme
MPVQHDPDGRRRLVAGGTTIGRFDAGERDGVPMADLFDRAPGVSAHDAARAVLAELPGWRIAADEELGFALLAAGGTKKRHGHLYSYDLRGDRPSWVAPPGVRLTDIDRPAADLVDAYVAAYPPDHPDAAFVPDDHEAELDALIAGGQYGPLLRGSGLAVADDGRVVGAIILGTVPGDPPRNGPWVIDVFRHPAYRGVGRALVARALALADVDTLGLIVTEGNDAARRLYERLGFRLLSSAVVVQL